MWGVHTQVYWHILHNISNGNVFSNLPPICVFSSDGCYMSVAYHPLMGSKATYCTHMSSVFTSNVEDCMRKTCETTYANAFNYQVYNKFCNIKSCTSGIVLVKDYASAQLIYADLVSNFVYIFP